MVSVFSISEIRESHTDATCDFFFLVFVTKHLCHPFLCFVFLAFLPCFFPSLFLSYVSADEQLRSNTAVTHKPQRYDNCGHLASLLYLT